MITADQLTALMPAGAKYLGADSMAKWADALNKAMPMWSITTPLRVAAFLAQIAVESGELVHLVENLNYSDVGLLKVFPHEFPTQALAAAFAHNPWKIADRVYAGRLGNGDEASHDGWTYRGRGLIQITGRANYVAFGTAIGDMSLLQCPDRLQTKDGAAQSAAWFFGTHGCNELADTGDIDAVSKRVNGSSTAKAERAGYYVHALKVLGSG